MGCEDTKRKDMSKSKNIIITILTVCVVFLLVVVAYLLGRGFSTNAISEASKEYVICPHCLAMNEVRTKYGVKEIDGSWTSRAHINRIQGNPVAPAPNRPDSVIHTSIPLIVSSWKRIGCHAFQAGSS